VSIDTVIFDMDGVIIDTESIWNSVRNDFAHAHGGHWGDGDQPAVMGASSMEWATAMRDNNGVDLSPREIYDGIIGELRDRYARHLPLIPGAPEAIARLARDYRLGVASSSPLELIEYALELGGLRRYFAAVVSSDDVARGKPEPDVYLEACVRLGTAPERAAAVEDSANGIRAAHAAGLAVIAIPNPEFPPATEAVGLANLVLGSIEQLTGAVVAPFGESLRGDIAPPGEGTRAAGVDRRSG
jgi:HAD superfamily hydrolase (TIGR01509 family)